MKNKVIHFGSGNIGRGLVAQIFKNNNIDLIFVDTNQKIIDLLNQQQKYNIISIDQNNTIEITDFKAYHINDKDLKAEILTANYLTTSIGVNNLTHLANFLKPILKNNTISKQIICFENGYKVSSSFAKMLGNLPKLNFVDVIVDRIIGQKQNDNLDVNVENYFEIVADQNQINDKQFLKDIVYSQNLDAYITRKLLLVNALHSTIGYWGYNKNIEHIHQVFEIPNFQAMIFNFSKEIAELIAKNFSVFTPEEIEIYRQKTLARFQNPLFNDFCNRVTRNPIQKLNFDERYMILYQLYKKYQKNPTILLDALTNILLYNNLEDQQSQQLQIQIQQQGFDEVAKQYLKITKTDLDTLLKKYNKN
ncbi:mannitol-1-phosphate 5-dehydrogenase [Candidatus Mycoplasma pogonae]